MSMSFYPSIHAHFNKCIEALNNNDLTSAYRHLQAAYKPLSRLDAKNSKWAVYYLNLSSIYNNSGRFWESIECCHKAQAIIKKQKQREIEAKAASNLASSYLNLSDYARAQKHAQRAIGLYKKQTNNLLLSEEYLTLGQILLRKGEWSQAIKAFSKALLLSRQSQNKQREGKTLIRLGYIFRADPQIFMEGGYLHLAIDHFRQAERYFREIDYKPGLIEAIYERANTYLSLGMVGKSRELINRMQSMIPEESPWRFFLLRLKYCISNREEQFEQAIEYARKLHHFYARAGDKKGQSDSLEMLGSSFYNLSNMQEAEKYGQQALELSKEIGDKLIESQSQQLLKAIGEVNKASRC
ncbi:tetratricopeptide repeat protein [Desulfoplanes sp. PS50]